MEKIKQWCLVISAVSIFSGLLSDFIPETALKKVFKAVAGVMLVYVFISSAGEFETVSFDVENVFNGDFTVSAEAEENSEKAVVLSAEKVIEDTVGEYLLSFNCDYHCSCSCSVDGGELSIDSIVFYGEPSPEHKEEIKDYIASLSERKIKTIFEGE